MRRRTRQQAAAIIGALERRSVWTPAALDAIDLDASDRRRLLKRGGLRRVSRGVYVSSRASASPAHALVIAALRVPAAVVALESALWLHGLVDTAPDVTCLALPEKAWAPDVADVPVRFIRTSHGDGVQDLVIEGVTIRVTSPARSVCDVLRHRRRLGDELVRSVVERFVRDRPGEIEELRALARRLRVHGALRMALAAQSSASDAGAGGRSPFTDGAQGSAPSPRSPRTGGRCV